MKTPFRACAAVATASFAVVAWSVLCGPPGRPLPLGMKESYCEAHRPGPVKQPANTWSNLGFILAGLALSRRARGAKAGLLACLIAFLGPASMALHASWTYQGGMVDTASMFLFVAFLMAQNLERLGWAKFWPAYLCLAGGTLWIDVAWHAVVLRAFAAFVTAYILSEAAVWCWVRPERRDPKLLGAAAGFFLAAMAFWLGSVNERAILCRPDSLWQGHAAWHLLCAAMAATLFLYLERELETL